MSEEPRKDRTSPEYESPGVELVMDRDELGRETLHAAATISELG